MTISQRSGIPLELTGWTMTGFPLTNSDHLSDFLRDTDSEPVQLSPNGMLSNGPVVFHSDFDITSDDIYDTYLDVSGWGKVKRWMILQSQS